MNSRTTKGSRAPSQKSRSSEVLRTGLRARLDRTSASRVRSLFWCEAGGGVRPEPLAERRRRTAVRQGRTDRGTGRSGEQRRAHGRRGSWQPTRSSRVRCSVVTLPGVRPDAAPRMRHEPEPGKHARQHQRGPRAGVLDHRLGGRPSQRVRRGGAAPAVPLRLLPGRGRTAGLARHEPHPHRRADADRRGAARRPVRHRGDVGGRPRHGLLHVRIPSGGLPLPEPVSAARAART